MHLNFYFNQVETEIKNLDARNFNSRILLKGNEGPYDPSNSAYFASSSSLMSPSSGFHNEFFSKLQTLDNSVTIPRMDTLTVVKPSESIVINLSGLDEEIFVISRNTPLIRGQKRIKNIMQEYGQFITVSW
ncbi:MAG: hypothetical protein ACFFD4_25615 [Candidatus Odinarchaeota archaeon]